jgi:hypothetical protein
VPPLPRGKYPERKSGLVRGRQSGANWFVATQNPSSERINRLQQQPISHPKVNFLGLQIADLFKQKRRFLIFDPFLTLTRRRSPPLFSEKKGYRFSICGWAQNSNRMLLFSFEGGVLSSIFVQNKKTAHR